MLNIEDYREHYNKYFQEFNRLAVGEYADLSYGSDKPNPTASSLESIIAYANYIIESKQMFFILNAGAGASSFVLRKVFDRVVCVDPNKRYLNLIKLVCKENGLQYLGFGPINNIKPASFDHLYYDYGDIERLPYLGYAIELARKSIYIDDTDCRDECIPYRKHVIALAESMKLKWFDCKEALDEHGRAGIIIEK